MNYEDLVTVQQGWNNLQEYGINALTGEADAYSMRLLCDLNQDGVKLMQSFLGDTLTFNEGSNWNAQVNGINSIASVMLPYSILGDLCRFILFHVEQKIYVHEMHSGQFTGTNEKFSEDILQDVKNTYVNYGKLRNAQANEGGRNVHAFSGRVT